MSGIRAVKVEEVDCGKKIEGTKRRITWKFQIEGKASTMELVSSTLSGKRIVTLNSMEIHSEQSILNFDFDFTHYIDGHGLRITRVPDSLNRYELRIDNQSFEDMLDNQRNHGNEEKQEHSSLYLKQKVENDPFSDFGAAAKETHLQNPSNSEFGEFDFDSYSKPVAAPPVVAGSISPPKAEKPGFNFAEFDFSNPAPVAVESNYETVNFQTKNPGNFETNSNQPIAFFQNFNKNVDSSAHDEDCFATMAYNKNSHYSDLMVQRPEEKSEWSDFSKPEEDVEKKGYLAQKLSNMKVDVSAKQVINMVKQTAEGMKMKVMGQDQSLI